MEEQEDCLSNEEYERLLALAHERCQKSKVLYDEALAIKETQPFEAVKLLYKAYELNYSSTATKDLFFSKTLLSNSPEILDKEGTPEELFYRGLHALSGMGRDRNNVIALQYFHLAAEKGYTAAQTRIGILYSNGEGGLLEDHIHAVKWWQPAAEKGDLIAQSCLGFAFYRGEGVIEDFTRALKWFRLAAKQGDARAQCDMGNLFLNSGDQQNYIEALKWLRLAAAQENTRAQFLIGSSFLKGEGVKQNGDEASKWFRLAANQGDVLAQYNLGKMFLQGDGIKQDSTEALKWLRLAADQGAARAQHAIAAMFLQGNGVKQDYTEAFKWFRMAADQGHVGAQVNSGRIYFSGLGDVAADINEALRWFTRAATQNDGEAQFYLGRIYTWSPEDQQLQAHERPPGIPNYVEALKWYRYAANQKEPISSQLRIAGDRAAWEQKFRIALQDNVKSFSEQYHFDMLFKNEKALQRLCSTHPNDFFNELQQDKIIISSEEEKWMFYLADHHFLQLAIHFQLHLAERIYFHGPISRETAFKLIKALQGFPETTERYGEAMRLLWNLFQLVDPKGYLVHYYLYKYLEKKPEDKYLYEKNITIEWSEAARDYCKAELTLSPIEFKDWLKTKIHALQKNKLTVSELNLLNELYFRCAHLKFEKAMRIKTSKNSLVGRATSWLLWSTPKPIDVTKTIELLKNISTEHKRFEEAQLLLQECRVHFKESFQTQVDDTGVGIKLGKGKGD